MLKVIIIMFILMVIIGCGTRVTVDPRRLVACERECHPHLVSFIDEAGNCECYVPPSEWEKF